MTISRSDGTFTHQGIKSMKNILLLLVLMISAGFQACQGDDVNGGAFRDGQPDLKRIETVLQRYDTTAVPVDVLKSGLPDKLLGMPRSDFKGQTSKFFGLAIATAEAAYKSDDRSVTVNLIDTGGAGAALSQLASWTEIEVDKQSDDGYERTILIDGQKGFERYSQSGKTGELIVLAGNRLIISFTGQGIGPDDLRKALGRIQLKSN